MDSNPCVDQSKENYPERNDVRESRLLAKQKQPKNDQQENGNPYQRILIQDTFQWSTLEFVGTHFDNLCDFP